MSSTQTEECLGKQSGMWNKMWNVFLISLRHIKAPFYSDIKKSNLVTSTIRCLDVHRPLFLSRDFFHCQNVMRCLF